MPRHTSRGFTLVEVAIGGALTTVILVATLQLFDQSGAAVEHSVRSSHMDQTFRQSLRAITNELRDSGFGDDGTDHVTSHPAIQTVSTDRVIFQRRIAFEGTPADWSTPITFELVGSPGENAGNGVDDDNDGTVDERRLARTQDGATTILADGFDVMNITRQLGENRLQVTLGSSRSLRHGTAPVVRQTTATIGLRNKP